MPLPSLYNKNVLIPHMGEKKAELNDIIGIEYIMNWFSHRIGDNNDISISDRVVILKSGTGSGKSTSIAPTLFRRFYKKWRNSQIVLTQPTQLTTQSVAYDINSIESFKENEPKIELFKNLGYQYKENVYKPLGNGILICTTGILLQILKNNTYDYIYNKYNVIIIDEVHNRSIDIDLILYFLKQLVENDVKRCPFIILMSATMDPYKYSKYFNTNTIFEVSGLTFPIENNYLQLDTPDFINKTIELVNNIHINNLNEILMSNNNDIIVFGYNNSVLETLYLEIMKLNNLYSKNYLLPIILTGNIFRSGDKNYNYIFSQLSLIKLNINNKLITPVRRIILGTNVAETGITIDTLKYCIDIGYVNSIEFNPIYNSNLLLIKPETQSSALQRKGRVGRKFEGKWYPLFTKNTFDDLNIDNIPNILSEEITFNILNILINLSKLQIDKNNNYIDNENNVIDIKDIKNYKRISIENIRLLDKITYDTLKLSLKKLFVLGYIIHNNYPTKLGLLANKFQKIKLEHIKIITSGYKYDANIEDLIIIVAYLIIGKNNLVESKFKSFNTQFNDINDKCIDSYNYNKLKTRLLVSCEFIDFLLFYRQFELICIKYKNIKKIEEWCSLNKVKYNSMLNIIRIKDEIIYDMIYKMNLNPYLNNNNLLSLLNNKVSYNNNEFLDEIKKIKYCLYEGLKLNICIYDTEKQQYINKDTGININPNSYLTKNLPIIEEGKKFIQTKPKLILYDSLILKYDNIIKKYIFSPVNCITILDGYINIDLNLIES